MVNLFFHEIKKIQPEPQQTMNIYGRKRKQNLGCGLTNLINFISFDHSDWEPDILSTGGLGNQNC